MLRTGEIVQTIHATPLDPAPFDHLPLQGIFPGEMYRDMVSHLPHTDRYVELRHKDSRLPDGRFARLEFELTDERLQLLDSTGRRFWKTVADALRHPDVRQAFTMKFATAITRRSVPPEARTSLRMSLVRDLPGYTISPHQDIPRKLITAQFYLPPDSCQSDQGTTFYRRTAAGALERAVTLPFMPNTGYAFPVTTDSWHGVDQLPAGGTPRNSLMLIWYLEGALPRLRSSAEHALRFLRSRW